ncbi:protein RAFTIN 1A-like [Phragmites australis]|uniref:protein RAFTIN 1A-like n=1 Tax=Phragmites australis TaxID=29695 RepID=UPI002D776801|nr:protein RAFTIN 1A-like [Phragmites australis]
MHSSALLLIVVAASIAEGRGLPAAGTPAAQFWEEALPGTLMPRVIAELVQKGIDSSPLKERYAAPHFSACGKPSSSEEAEAATGIFFHEAQAREGSVMTVSLPPAAVPAFLPRDVAEKVPFANLTDVLATFNIAQGSTEATKAGQTLCGCRAAPLAGEQKACATSLEGTVRAATRMLGTTASGRVWVAASEVPRDGLPRQAYVVSAVAALDGDRHVGCHDEPFPYAVFHCHTAQSSTRAYEITLSSLRGRGPAVAMVALCHRDTSNWNPAHPAFEMLGTQPGGAPVCHFMPYANLVFSVKA